MKERQFAGMLNSKSVWGQSYFGGSESLRFHKYCKIDSLFTYSHLMLKWYRACRIVFPSWGKSLWNYSGEITFTQRQENKGRKVKKFEMFRWKSR